MAMISIACTNSGTPHNLPLEARGASVRNVPHFGSFAVEVNDVAISLHGDHLAQDLPRLHRVIAGTRCITTQEK
jgi:hypothetical protein